MRHQPGGNLRPLLLVAAVKGPTIGKLEEKLSAQRQIKQLEQKRSDFRRKLFDAQDAIDQNKDGLLDDVEQRLQQSTHSDTLFTIRFTIV